MANIQAAQLAGTGVDGVVRPTEDVVVSLGTSVVLLDGATSLRPSLPSGGWYAATLAAQLGTELTAHPSLSLQEVLAKAITEIVRQHGLRPGESASSTVALLRWTADEVEALVLADSPIVAFTTSGVQVVADERLASLPRRGGGYRERLRDGGGYGADHANALRESARGFDGLRNVDGGFWVAEADPAAAEHAFTARWRHDEVTAVLMATDGMSCGVEDYGLFTWPEVLDTARADGVQSALDRVRDAEREDPDGTRWPRPKLHDDKTLVLVDWT